MGVDAQIGVFLTAIVKAGLGDARNGTPGGQAVDGGVGPVIVPMAVFDILIGRLLAGDQGESANRRAVRNQDILVAHLDVRQDDVLPRVAAEPLVEIAAGAHIGPGNVKNTHNFGNVLPCGFSDFHNCSSDSLRFENLQSVYQKIR